MVPAHTAQPSQNTTVRPGHPTEASQRWCKAAAIALFVVLALIALQVGGLGVSGLFAQMAQLETERLTAAAAPRSAQGVGHIERRLHSSLRFASGNPWALEQVGALNLARMRASTVPREAVALASDARIRFRQALVQRPTSPFLWANLALAKLYLDEVDAEFFAALRHAEELGPWEPVVQQVSVFVGLAAWRELDPEMRQVLVRTLDRGAHGNAEKLVQIVRSYRRFDLICGVSKYNSITGRECAKNR